MNAADVTSTFEGGVWAVQVQVGNTAFDLARDLNGESEANSGAILWRRVNGSDVVPPPLASSLVVNGEVVAVL